MRAGSRPTREVLTAKNGRPTNLLQAEPVAALQAVRRGGRHKQRCRAIGRRRGERHASCRLRRRKIDRINLGGRRVRRKFS